MLTRQPRYTKEESCRRGEEIYERDIRPTLPSEELGRFVAIDIETGTYQIDSSVFMATERLLQLNPDAQIWLMRAGEQAAYRIGGRILASVEA